MTDQHPITPPPELLQQWVDEFYASKAAIKPGAGTIHIATQAAQWGANQELEACREEILDGYGRLYIDDCKLRVRLADDIWTVRRPKPKNLAEEALAEIQMMEGAMYSADLGCDFTATRRALERLQELEGQA